MWTKKLAAMLLAAVMIFSAATPAFAEIIIKDGELFLKVTGCKYLDAKSGSPFYRNFQRQIAQLDALRYLAEEINDIPVSETSGEYIPLSDTIKTEIHASLDNSIIKQTDVQLVDFSRYEVTLEMPLFGKGSIMEKVAPRDYKKEPFIKPTTNAKNEKYTGLIVDCRGLKLEIVLIPMIEDTLGNVIYSFKNFEYEEVVNGIVSYTEDINQVSKAGKNPIIIKAMNIQNNYTPIISSSDSDFILSQNQFSHFLDRCAVVFVK